ncbi:MAG: 3-deoxy-D-manno-octulosonic acid transferase, partial [Cyclobacteriaceae bacterium]|nr:3-deoxy-D-manno-octulosonic acid transferase [Cyclobacteriaceae bacterium]
HFFRNMLMGFDHFFVQNETSKQLLNTYGFDNVSVSGDTRFDRVKEICSKPDTIEIAALFKGSDKVMVIGSSWPNDIELLLPYINDKKNPIKYIVAPHEIGKEKINKLTKGITVKYQLYSEADPGTILSAKVLVIDNIGMLSSLYQYGEIAYIGGAFGEGLHNILEAATFGLPIIFGRGKDNNKYQEAVDLLKLGGAFEVSNSRELEIIVNGLLEDEMKLENASTISSDYVKNNAGATENIMDFLNNYLN